MEKKKTNFLMLGLVVFWLLNISILWQNLGSKILFANDYYDRQDYARDGGCIFNRASPLSRYHQRIPANSHLPFCSSLLFFHAHLGDSYSFWLFSSIISLIMVGFLSGTITLLYPMLPIHKNSAFLLLLPAALYFTTNRFDILPSFLVLLSLFFLQRQKSLLVGIILGIATSQNGIQLCCCQFFCLTCITRNAGWIGR